MVGLPRGQIYVLTLLLIIAFNQRVGARELVPDDDGPEQQEEVMPLAPEPPPPPPTQPSALPVQNAKWMATDFANQTQALGWASDAFQVPTGMEDRVLFWKDIYTKYTSEQGILHDSKFVNLIYEGIDFSDITARTDLTDRQREKARRKRVDEKKKEIAARLKRLQTVKDGASLDGDDKRYWDMFSKIDEPKKFADAAGRHRLRFQLGQRNQFASGIFQSGRYQRQMEEIFRQEGLPIELTRLAYVESSFNLRARSKRGASGLWQFMRSTARLYLRMDNSADERNDPLRATRAAAKKLRDDFQMLKSWPLAITAYNRGSSGVRRLVEKTGTTNIVELTDVRKGRFGFASASYYASFLAVLDVEHHADQHFGMLEVLPEVRGADIQMPKSLFAKDFMKWFGGDKDLAQLLNPAVTDAVWKGKAPLNTKHYLRVPLTQETQARGELQ